MEVGLSFAKNSMLEKRESKLNNLEQERQKVSLNEIIGGLKEKIKNSIGFLFGAEEDKKIKEFEERLQESKEISNAAGEFFRFLIPKSLKRPDKEYKHTEREEDYLKSESGFLQSIKRLKGKIAMKDFKEVQQVFIEEYENDDEAIGNIKEEKIRNITEQTCICNFKQEGGQNTIKEVVNNLLDKSNEADYAVARALIIKDSKTGVKLDLSQLLPDEVEFCPADLCKFEWYFDKEEEKAKVKFMLVDLESYKGNKDSEGSFSAIENRAFYGDLTKKGGLLSLLHEVAHEWQKVYYEDSGRKNFKDFHGDVCIDLAVLADLKREADSGSLNKVKFDEIKLKLLKSLENKGVGVDMERFLDNTGEVGEGEIKIKSILEEEFIIKSDKFNQLLEGFERGERDAWAHAIRVIRFLRKKGIDLEPQLKTLDDFKDIIDSCLETYQRSAEDMVVSSERGVRFARQKA